MRLLFTANEVRGLYKLGGLGDVARDLPESLLLQNHDIRLAAPLHPEIKLSRADCLVSSFNITYDNQSLPVKVWLKYIDGSRLPIYLFEEDLYLSQYTDASDNHADKYAVLSLCIAAWVAQHSTFWQPHLIHLNDWHTALIPLILKHLFNYSPPSLLTIHNLAYQGSTTTPVFQKLGISPETCPTLNLKTPPNFDNFMLQGIVHADFLTTVSPTYAKEIQTTEFGEGLEEYLKSRHQSLQGIINGLSSVDYIPQSDPHLVQSFSIDTVEAGKNANKSALQKSLGLPVKNIPLIGYIGRVDGHQKGIDLIIGALKSGNLPPPNTQFVFLGTGDPQLEAKLHASAKDSIIITRFDEPLAHQIYAGADCLLIPSSFEPCGLIQLIAMRYGTLPIAKKTGGLADTIKHNQTGVLFEDHTLEAFMSALMQGLALLSNPQRRLELQKNMMSQDFSWEPSAILYSNIYQNMYTGLN
jgi:starch synthase